MNVSSVLVTRGDVDLTPIIDAITASGIDDIVVYDNSAREDLAVFGRYAGIAEARHPLIFTQDDDVLHTPEGIEEIVGEWENWASHGVVRQGPVRQGAAGFGEVRQGEDGEMFLVANQPQAFRHAFYVDHCLTGFGCVFHRDAPERAFERFSNAHGQTPIDLIERVGINRSFHRTCDIVFTGLTPRVLVDVEYRDLPWASAENRMWKQPTHHEERQAMLDLVLQVRDNA